MSILLTLFAAGVLTILLPCILPLVPIVLGVSLSGRRRSRPLVTVLGMVASFVLFTFLAQLLLQRLVHVANVIRIATDYALLLFGICFLVTRARVRIALAVLGAFAFFWNQGWAVLLSAPVLGGAAVALGGRIAARIQALGAGVQRGSQAGLGRESLLATFIVGLTLGLVWVPCAGPALGFALALVRDERGPKALLALTAYAAGAATPLLLIGYGGQSMVRSARWLTRYSGRIKQFAGGLLLLSAVALQFQLFLGAQTWLAEHTGFGDFGTHLEQRLYGEAMAAPAEPAPQMVPAGMAAQAASPAAAAPASTANLPKLPDLGPAPELAGLGPWYNSPPLTMASLRGKVVLVDFWTYSCINCVRTLPELRQLWAKYRKQPFVIVGVHAPEFTFEKSPANVAAAIKRHGLSYPIAQDNDLRTWDAFNNRYWPAKYLIDAQGRIRYTHFGEGGDQATQQAIRSLLAEIGHATRASAQAARPTGDEPRISPETYLSSRDWNAFANRAGGANGAQHRYQAPGTLGLDRFALVGTWKLVGDERQVLRSDRGEIRYHALAGQVNLVLGMDAHAASVLAQVTVDGKPGKQFTVDRHDLFNLYSGAYGDHEITVRFQGKGVAAYAFTFGG